MRSFLIFLLFLTAKSSFGQATKPELEVIRGLETNASATVAKIKAGKQDTAQVRLMVKAMRIYYNNPSNGMHELDTAFVLAKKVYNLSQKLHFGEGISEAVFMMGKVRIKQNNPNAKITCPHKCSILCQTKSFSLLKFF